jgi:hypothetical protein
VPRELAGHVHRPQGVLERVCSRRRVGPAGALQLEDPAEPWSQGSRQVLLRLLLGPVPLGDREAGVAVDRIGDDATPLYIPAYSVVAVFMALPLQYSPPKCKERWGLSGAKQLRRRSHRFFDPAAVHSAPRPNSHLSVLRQWPLRPLHCAGLAPKNH